MDDAAGGVVTVPKVAQRTGQSLRTSASCREAGAGRGVEGGDVRLFLLLFIGAVTLCACQNPGARHPN